MGTNLQLRPLDQLREAHSAKAAGDLATAKIYLDHLMTIGAGDIRVWREWADWHIQSARAAEILPAMAQSGLGGDPEYMAIYGRVLRNAGQAQQAAEILQRAVQTAPQNLAVRFEFAQAVNAFLPTRPNSDFKKISVAIPCRFTRAPAGDYWVSRAVECIRAQSIASHIPVEICLGIDGDAVIPDEFANQPDIIFGRVPADAPRGQPSAVNAAAAAATGDVLAHLEDDDFWEPERLAAALELLPRYDFISSTQASVNPAREVIGFHDYVNPSTWVMRRELWQHIGPMNPEFRWHLDAEWLGRLNQSGALRCHQVDNSAPSEWTRLVLMREFFFHYQAAVGIGSGVFFTGLDKPLCNKTIHEDTMTSQVSTGATHHSASLAEYERMTQIYGGRPF